MIDIFIPQDTLEDIILENMPSTTAEEDQDIWFKIFSKQKYIYVASDDDHEYVSKEEPLFYLSDSYGVEIRYETKYINGIANNHDLVCQYPNGIFLLNIDEADAEQIQQDYGVICQSVDNLDSEALNDPNLSFSPNMGQEGYTWKKILSRINSKHYPSNHLTIIDRYLFSGSEYFDSALQNVYEIVNAMLPTHKLKRNYKLTLFIGEQEDAKSVPLELINQGICEMLPLMMRPYGIDFELFFLYHQSPLYKSTHNRRILTNYTITTIEHMTDAFKDGISKCQQTIHVHGLYSTASLDGLCDAPYKMHDDLTEDICDYIGKWVYNTSKNNNKKRYRKKMEYNDIYMLNSQKTDIKTRYGTKRKYNEWTIYEKTKSLL